MKPADQVILPEELQNNEVAINIKKYLSMLGPSSGFYSCILYGNQGKYYFLNKDPTFPYVDFDWTMYILMRSQAKTILTSGLTVRSQQQVYGETRGTFGRELLEKIYQSNRPEPFNLVVYSRQEDEDIKSLISQDRYKFISIKQLAPAKLNLKQIAERINELKMGPVMYENGEKSLGKAMNEVKDNENSFVEMIILSLFQGEMPPRFIMQEYSTQVLDRDFTKVWESQAVNSTAKHDDGRVLPITLKFVVYLRKKKNNTMMQIHNEGVKDLYI